MTLYVFNPEHDICLANGDPNFVPPSAALTFARDCAWLMAWAFGSGYVLCPEGVGEESLALARSKGVTAEVVTWNQWEQTAIDAVVPWGWDKVLLTQLLKHNVPQGFMPTARQIDEVRAISHRIISMQASNYIRTHIARAYLYILSPPAAALTSQDDCQQFLQRHGSILLKAPWSGSGQGLRPVREEFTTHDKGWIANVIKHQRCVMGEPRYSVVQDFALEFECGEDVRFVGYSLFDTQGGAYKSNFLLGDETIQHYLSRYIPMALLAEVEQILLDYLKTNVLGRYRGYLGIDMFIYGEENHYCLNPMVEINFRLTMGLVAHELLRRMPNMEGKKFTVEYKPQAGGLALTPLTPQTQYVAKIVD